MITLKRNQAKITLWPTHTHTHTHTPWTESLALDSTDSNLTIHQPMKINRHKHKQSCPICFLTNSYHTTVF